MNCDGCEKLLEHEDEVALLLRIPDAGFSGVDTKRTLGKQYGKKTNVDGILTWAFCFECVLDKFLGSKKS